MSDRAPYSRLYWALVDDPKFVAIYDDDRAFSWWVRLLMIADQAHPASAHTPVRCPKRVFSALVAVGLVDEQPGGRFRVHGLDAERERRSAAARTANAARWDSERTEVGPGTHLLDETRRDEQSRDKTRRADGTGLKSFRQIVEQMAK